MNVQNALGLTNHSKVFDQVWRANDFAAIERQYGEITQSRQSAFADSEVRSEYEGYAANRMNKVLEQERGTSATESKAAMDEGAIGNATPLVYDPEIMSILKEEAPILERVPEQGQNGFAAYYNRIDGRDAALGFMGEADALDLTDNNKSGISLARDSTDMKIWADLVEISDFAAAASEFYFDVRETTLGERVANHAQDKEVNLLYADPSQGLTDGSAGDSNAYEGFATTISDNTGADNDVDKTSTDISGTDGFFKDVKAEVKSFLQSNKAVNVSDLEIWTSHTAFDELENEAGVHAKVDMNENSIDYGYKSINIGEVPVYPTHNIQSHTFDDGTSTYTVGSEGDVFLMNRREMRFRSLLPLSTIPLARLGLGEMVAMAEFGAPVLRGNGHLCKYLKNYQI